MPNEDETRRTDFRAFSETVRQLGPMAAKLWLLGLTVVMTFVAVQFLTAILIQTKVAQVKVGTQQLSIGRVKEILPVWKTWKDQINDAAEQIRKRSVTLAEAGQDLISMKAQIQSYELSFQNRIAATLGRISEVDKKSAGLPGKVTSDMALDDILSKLEAWDANRPDNTPPRVDAKALRELQGDISLGRIRVSQLQERENGIAIEIKDLKSNYDAQLKGFARIFRHDGSEIPIEDAETVIHVLTDLSWISTYDPSHKSWLAFYEAVVFEPPELVTLALVLTMGVIGSTLFLLSQLLMNSSALTLISYMFRPFFGAITALTIFVLANAGLPVLADTIRSGQTNVNPYFVSFIAIVSGLMTERALAAIQSAGASVLKDAGTVNRDRFAREGVIETVPESERSELRQTLDMDEEKFAGFTSGKSAVDPHQQAVAAAFLRRPIRDLFSDLPAPG